MSKRLTIRQGDIFEVPLKSNQKGYFQFMMLDTTQLNSEVIRVFKRRYSTGEQPDSDKIVQDETDFYVHVVIKLGVKMNLWYKVGHTSLESDIKAPHFRLADDDDDPSVQWSKSYRWSIWQVGEDFQSVGELTNEQRKYSIGLVINPIGILEIMEGNKYPPYYPD